MIVKDKIYGKVEIKEPVLIELLNSPSVLRLKKISQFGIPDKYYHFKNFSRYEHSVGVMILLRKLKTDLEEQIAGLLHDVSILAFSHVADWVFGGGRNGIENFHDKLHGIFIKKTEIPKILEKFGFSPKRILEIENFSLLEKEIPDICADRVDYALREFKYWLNSGIVKKCIKALANFNSEIVFNNENDAFNFATNFLELQTRHWGAPETVMRYHIFSDTLKIAVEKKIISKKDFYKNEEVILSKIKKYSDKNINKILKVLEKKRIKLKNSGRRVFKKFRHVDPKVISDGKLIRLSEIESKYKKILNKHKKINKKGVLI